MGNLQEDASTVATTIACLSTAMLHILKHAQRIVHQLMALVAMKVDHHADTAGIVFVCRGV